MTILVTGADGFIGRNLCVFLRESGFEAISTITRHDSQEAVLKKISDARFIYHLAGINRPENDADFKKGNTDLTALIVNQLIVSNKKTPIVLTSSIQAEFDNVYGVSKAGAETVLCDYKKQTGADITNSILAGSFSETP